MCTSSARRTCCIVSSATAPDAQDEISDEQPLYSDAGDDQAIRDEPNRKGERAQLASSLQTGCLDDLRHSMISVARRADVRQAKEQEMAT